MSTAFPHPKEERRSNAKTDLLHLDGGFLLFHQLHQVDNVCGNAVVTLLAPEITHHQEINYQVNYAQPIPTPK
jgi:hypothetical protein